SGVYAQDEWRPIPNLTLTGGLRIDAPKFKNTAYDNAVADTMTFRDASGAPVHYNSGSLPGVNLLISPRLGFNYDLHGEQKTQIRGGTGIFTGRPAYVWISNQIGNTGVLTGFIQADTTTAFPFSPNPDAHKPANVTGAPATTFALALTDPNFKFPQLWRSNIGVDQRLPWGLTGTAEFLYSKDVNGIAYINANLPAVQAAFSGPDSRPRWTSNKIYSAVNNAIVLTNEGNGYSWNLAFSLERAFRNGWFAKVGYTYGVSRNTVDAGSIASGSWTGNPILVNPNTPAVGYSQFSPGPRQKLRVPHRRGVGIDQDRVAGPRARRNGTRIHGVPAHAVGVADLRKPAVAERPLQRKREVPGVPVPLVREHDRIVDGRVDLVRGPARAGVGAAERRLHGWKVGVDVRDPVHVLGIQELGGARQPPRQPLVDPDVAAPQLRELEVRVGERERERRRRRAGDIGGLVRIGVRAEREGGRGVRLD